ARWGCGTHVMTPALCDQEFHHSKGSSPETGARLNEENRRSKPCIQRYRQGEQCECRKEQPNEGDAHVDGTFRVIPVDRPFRRESGGSSEAASDPPAGLCLPTREKFLTIAPALLAR